MTTIVEYLRSKYGTEKPTTMLKTEAKAFGMPYPLRSGWLAEFGGMEITPGMMHRLRDGLTKRGGEKASAGLIAIGAPAVAGPSSKEKPSKASRKRERQAQKVKALEVKLASPRVAPQRPATVYTAEGVDVRSAEFLRTWAWRELRYATIKRYGPVCQCCGATAKTSGEPIQVDHIKPRSLFPELALDPENTQVMCGPCNMGKSNKDFTDWR